MNKRSLLNTWGNDTGFLILAIFSISNNFSKINITFHSVCQKLVQTISEKLQTLSKAKRKNMSGSGDPTLPFFPPDPKPFFHLYKKNLVRSFSMKKVGAKKYFYLSMAFMCIIPLRLAAMLNCACCLQYIKALSVAHTGNLITQTIHWNNVIISPLTQNQKKERNPYLPYLYF